MKKEELYEIKKHKEFDGYKSWYPQEGGDIEKMWWAILLSSIATTLFWVIVCDIKYPNFDGSKSLLVVGVGTLFLWIIILLICIFTGTKWKTIITAKKIRGKKK